jgi:hypothetical protein
MISILYNSYTSVAKVEVDGFGVADVEDAVGLRWESRDHLAARFLQMLSEQIHGLVRDHVAVGLVVLARLVEVDRLAGQDRLKRLNLVLFFFYFIILY